MTGSTNFFSAYMPHGMCYVWRPDILGLHVTSDVLIAIAYFSIPFALHFFLKQRSDVPFRGVLYMFSIFIFACGLTHLMGIWVVWNGHYGIQGLLKSATAIASIATAIMLYPIMPKMISLRSPQELEQSNAALQTEIAHRKQQEVQTSQLQTDLAHMGRVSTMGQMATGLAHELNQPLLAISQSTDTALFAVHQSASVDEEIVEYLEDVQAETQRAGEIIRALRQLVSKEPSSHTAVDFNALAGQVVQLVAAEGRCNNVDIKFSSNTLANPVIDRVQIAQVMVNILRNSIQAIAEAGHSGGLVTINAEELNDALRISIKDTGPGLDSDVELFKPFETNKTDGMGLGLSISRSIIESHGGKITAINHEQGGACFQFTLPLVSS